jgi:hypothetical protein
LAEVRLDESLYAIKNIGENGLPLGEFNRFIAVPVDEKSCLPPMIFQDKACSDATRKHPPQAPRKESGNNELVFMNDTIYIDPGISGDMKKKVLLSSLLSCYGDGSCITRNHQIATFRQEKMIFLLFLLMEGLKNPLILKADRIYNQLQ